MTDMRERMKLFHVIDDGVVILRMRGGKYRQVPLYQRDGDVYAALGGCFVRLMGHGTTTDPNTSWIEAGCPHAVWNPGPKPLTYSAADAVNVPAFLTRLAAG